MLMAKPWPISIMVKARLVNCDLVGVEDLALPCRAVVSSTASMQKPTSIVIDSRQARTFRLNQSITAVR